MICAKRVSIIDAELTLALWVYLMPASKSGATQNLLSLQENADLEHPVNFVQLKVASDGSVFFNYGISDATKDSATAADFRLNYRQWTHLAVTLAAGSMSGRPQFTCYKNGAALYSREMWGGSINAVLRVNNRFGGDAASGRALNAYLEKVWMFERTLSADEINQLMSYGELATTTTTTTTTTTVASTTLTYATSITTNLLNHWQRPTTAERWTW